jgi:hypothetical protein
MGRPATIARAKVKRIVEATTQTPAPRRHPLEHAEHGEGPGRESCHGAAHLGFQLHFTPSSASWLNLVERWFRELTDQRIRRGAFPSVPELIAAMQEFIATNKDTPKPFVWTASVEKILQKM